MTDLTGGIRRAAEPPRPQGHREPSTAGRNAGEPTLTGSPPAEAPQGANSPRFPVPVRRHEDHGWHELHAVEHRAYTETLVAVTLGEGEGLVIDPTAAQIWRVAVEGAATITIPNAEFPQPRAVRTDSPERMRSWSCVLIVSVGEDAPFPVIEGAKWEEGRAAPDVLPPDGSTPDSWQGRYVFTFVHDPVSDDVLGFEGGSRFG